MKQCMLFLIIILACNTYGCSWVGETAGKVSAKMERKSDDIQEGYKKGYKEEKAKEDKQ